MCRALAAVNVGSMTEFVRAVAVADIPNAVRRQIRVEPLSCHTGRLPDHGGRVRGAAARAAGDPGTTPIWSL